MGNLIAQTITWPLCSTISVFPHAPPGRKGVAHQSRSHTRWSGDVVSSHRDGYEPGHGRRAAAPSLLFKLIPYIAAALFITGASQALYLRKTSPLKYATIGHVVVPLDDRMDMDLELELELRHDMEEQGELKR